MVCGGIVRVNLHELADQKRSRLSHGEFTPFSERGGAVLRLVRADEEGMIVASCPVRDPATSAG